jgi:hypothetical protein
MIHYLGSDHQQMRAVYNRIRLQIGMIVRDLEEMRGSGAGVMEVLSLDALKLLIEEEQQRINQDLTEMIATRAITPAMGSSLINDSVFAHDICLNLINAAQNLFATGELQLTHATHDVVLDKTDLTQIGAEADANHPTG